MVNSNRKGKAGERELAAMLNAYLGTNYRRSQQYCGSAGDADLTPEISGIHIECKRCETLHVDTWLQQAQQDAEGSDNIPVVCMRQNGKAWKVAIYLYDLVRVSRAIVRKVGMGDGTSTIKEQ